MVKTARSWLGTLRASTRKEREHGHHRAAGEDARDSARPQLFTAYRRDIHRRRRSLCRYFRTSPDQLDAEHLITYQLWLRDQKHASYVLFNQIVSVLRFFYDEVLHRPDVVERICYARHERRLPVVLSIEETVQFLSSIDHPRQRQEGPVTFHLLRLCWRSCANTGVANVCVTCCSPTPRIRRVRPIQAACSGICNVWRPRPALPRRLRRKPSAIAMPHI